MSETNKFIYNDNILKVFQSGLSNITNVSGIYNGITSEIKTQYDRSTSEKVIDGYTNCFIVLGTDRDGSKGSGFGGKGHTGAAAIDIVAGHLGCRPVETLYSNKITSDKDFKNDASRIYISQKCDLDKYFQLPVVNVVLGNKNIPLEDCHKKSGIGIKSDHIRVIGREQIKIVTSHGGFNSYGKKVNKGGIAILAGYDKMAVDKTLSPQPMVKGNNLVELLRKIVNSINDSQSIVSDFMKEQRRINNILIEHKHFSNKPGLETSALIGATGLQVTANFNMIMTVIPNLISSIVKNEIISSEYFNPTSDKYINSNWNFVN